MHRWIAFFCLTSACLPDHAEQVVDGCSEELCDGVDNDCDGEVDEGVRVHLYRDADGDGVGSGERLYVCADEPGASAAQGDCDDHDETALPGALEVCDGIDNDCDGLVDPGMLDTFYADLDGDGFGSPDHVFELCDGDGLPERADDCDDLDPAINPAAEEICDGIDQDCDGQIDEDVPTPPTWYLDLDQDGFGGSDSEVGCAPPDDGFPYTLAPGDCDDDNPEAWPGAPELCDAVDNDCDGAADEEEPTWYVDADGDGYGDAFLTSVGCSQPAGFVGNDGDCDDSSASVNPGQPEVCGGGDEDCDGTVDGPGAVDATTWHPDGDGDGFGTPSGSTVDCDPPPDHTADGTDCDDGEPDTWPGATELCDGIDNDCDGDIDEGVDTPEWYADADGDGWGAGAAVDDCEQPVGTAPTDGDCDDGDPDVHPAADEVLFDGVDNDCDPTTSDEYVCGDGVIDPDEECDDLDDDGGDGCSADCEIEPNTECLGEPSECVTDAEPEVFDFIDQTDVDTDTLITSNTVVLSGFYGTLPAAVSGPGTPELLLGGVPAGSSADVSAGDELTLRLTSAPDETTERVASLDLDGLAVDWRVVTAASCVAGVVDFSSAGTTSWSVPDGCTTLEVKAWGAGGGGGHDGSTGGGGGFAGATITATPGETLTITVGSPGTAGGSNRKGGSGGGGTSIRDGDGTAMVIAGGGGGGGAESNGSDGQGGAGGGASGQAGNGANGCSESSGGGTGGTPSAPGSGGHDGRGHGVGLSGNGGNGGSGGGTDGGPGGGAGDGKGGNGRGVPGDGGGGGGGGGYFGGGGGGASCHGGGGGGGSSYAASSPDLQGGNRQTPGNTGDSDYAGNAGGGAGQNGNGVAGRVVIRWSP